MLPREENELLTRTGPATPMGRLIRSYWIPALLSEEIPEPDGPPAQVRILGEELVAFRDSAGRIGLLADHCSHRGTSLFYGRNEECGLRCIYHGWKYDVEGNVVDTPAEPAGSDFKKKIRQTAYPTREAAGIIFAYMGPREKMPLFPAYEWTRVPRHQTYVTKCLQECNYLQGLEGECDSSHLSYLHRSFKATGRQTLYSQDSAPRYEVEETDFGLRMVALRSAGEGLQYVRVSSFVMPLSGCVPAGLTTKDLDGFEIHFYVPADDHHSWRYDLGFRRTRPVREEEVHRRRQIGPGYRRIRNTANHYLQDRQLQKTESFTGIEDYLNHDSCATESMGSIYDRGQEHLGTSDKAVIALRRFLLKAVKSVQEGKDPPHLVKSEAENLFPQIDSIAEVVPADRHWSEVFLHLKQGVAVADPEPLSA
jgi:phenylpropionate dioxygenase-like ring-hydroxylating dioxygenase large terminal subunit